MYIMNEAAMNALNLTKDDLGKVIVSGDFDSRRGSIVGFVKNFNFASLSSPISPLVIGTKRIFNALRRYKDRFR